jgi:hypothetical protein
MKRLFAFGAAMGAALEYFRSRKRQAAQSLGLLVDIYLGADRGNESGFLDDRDRAVYLDNPFSVENRMPGHDRIVVGRFAQVAKLLDRELHGASAFGVETLAEEGDGTRVVGSIADRGEQAFVGPSKDVLI